MSIASEQHRLIDHAPVGRSDYPNDVPAEEAEVRRLIRRLTVELQEASCKRSDLMNEKMGRANVTYVHLDGATYAYPVEESEAGTFNSISQKVDPTVNPQVAMYEDRVISTAVRKGNDHVVAQAYVGRDGKRHSMAEHIVGPDATGRIAPKIFYSIPEGSPLVRVDNREPSCTNTQARITGQIAMLEDRLRALQLGAQEPDPTGTVGAVRDFSIANRHLRSKINDATTVKAKKQSTHLHLVSAHARYLVWFALAMICVVVTARYRSDGSMGGLGAGILLVALLSTLWGVASWIASSQ